MKIWATIQKLVDRGIGRVKAWYQTWWEGAEFSTSRYQKGNWWSSRAPDANEANTPQSRQEIIRRAQDFERNNGFTRRLATIYVTYVIGSGLPIKPASGDEEWNLARKELWDRWCEMPDLTSMQDFDSFQVMMAWRAWIDGAGYVLKTRGDKAPFRPRVQFIEAKNIQTPPEKSIQKNIFDGKETDGRGRITGYWVRQCISGEESFKRYDARDIEPICDVDHPGELHSYSYLAPVLNDIHDLDDLYKLAMDKAKEALEVKNVFKTESGDIPDGETRRISRYNTTSDVNTGETFTKERLQEFEQKLGGKTIALRLNETVDQLKSESPNQIEQAHFKIIAGRICAGVNIPLLMVFPESIQGTVGRAILDDFTTYCATQSKMFQRVLKNIYRFVTEEECKFERMIADKPPDWWKCSIRAPRAPNVDVGRNSSAMIAELEAGATTYDAIYAPQGLDAFEQLEIKAKEEAQIDALCVKYKLTPDRIRRSISEALKVQLQAEQQGQQNQDAEDAVPTA